MWFPNRWPAIDGDRCEVVLYSPRHDAAFWELGVDGAMKVVALWSERTATLGARDDVHYVLPFENRGAAVGATISHPHGQIYAFPEPPREPLMEIAAAMRHGCAVCAEEVGDRLVMESAGVRAWTPSASKWPYELLVAPVEHVRDLPAAPHCHRPLAAALVDVLERLDRLFEAPMPYMLWVHQAPTVVAGVTEHAHLHVHIAPLHRAPALPRFVAAGELGSGVYFNPVAPEDAARELRGVAP
jgi:UDPglucose--hexose-1-phosphate uridylyltransferase